MFAPVSDMILGHLESAVYSGRKTCIGRPLGVVEVHLCSPKQVVRLIVQACLEPGGCKAMMDTVWCDWKGTYSRTPPGLSLVHSDIQDRFCIRMY